MPSGATSHLLRRHAEVARHEVGVVLADRDEAHRRGRSRARISSIACRRYGSPRPSRNRSSPCSVHADRPLQRAPQRLGQPEQQRVRQVDDVEPRLGRAATRAACRSPCAGSRARRAASRRSCRRGSSASTLICRFDRQPQHPRRSPSSRSRNARRVAEERRAAARGRR